MPGELILVIEDNDKNMKLLRDALQFHGYRVAEAGTAEEGLVMARAQTPALILMDIQLPGMDGITALGHLRADEETRSIPVLAVTASARPEDRQRILNAGFDGYQAKPFKVKELPQILGRYLGRRSQGTT